MGNLVIYHSDGEQLQARATITKAQQSVKLLGEDVINVEMGAKEIVPFSIGDYIEWCGKTYTLNQLPSVTKNTSVDFAYPSITFEGEQYELLDSAWLLPTNTYGDSFHGNLKDFLDILISNTERSGRHWVLGQYPTDTDYKTLTYTNTNCLQVLQNLCQEYKVEFEIRRQGDVRVLNIKEQVGDEFPTRFEYGRTGGAYKIDRKTATNQNVITRLFCFGSDKNLPGTYRNSKLCLPGKTRNESYITDAESVKFYGIRENVKMFDDIFPARYGTVTAVSNDSEKVFFDTSMDFDLNEKDGNGTKWLIPSTVAKIQFNSGGLAGYTFEISEYDHAAKKFKIKTYTDANGLQFPNPNSAAFQIHVGDEYFITDIRVPQSYIDAAEAKLQTEGEKYFTENCRTHVNYGIAISPLFLKHLYGDTKLTYEIFKVGDTVEIYDFDLECLKKLRVAGFTRNLLDPYDITLTISENVEVQSSFQRVVRELTEIKQKIYQNDIAAADNARRNWLATQDVLNSVFDPEGHYYSEKIKPLSIETMMLATGARSQQFVLKNVNFLPNYEGDPNQIQNTEGTLEHFTISDTGVRTWTISSGNTTLDQCAHADGEGHTHIHGATVNETIYHIYAKCSRSGDRGFILYDCAEHTVESDPQYYHFLVGTLTSVITDPDGTRAARNIALTYGSSSINGRFINTGRIQSQDGSVYIDLDKNEIAGRFNFQDGLISNVIGISDNSNDVKAGIGGTNYHQNDSQIYNFNTESLESKNGKKIALWANRTYPENQSLEYVNADTVILQDGTIRMRNHSNGRLVFFADPKNFFVHIPELQAGTTYGTAAKFGNLKASEFITADTAAYSPYVYADNFLKVFSYQDKSFYSFAPTIVWGGQLFRTSDGYSVSAYSPNFSITVTATRESTGIITLNLSKQLPPTGIFITAQGWETDNGQAYVTIKSMAVHLGHLTVKVSDDNSTNDYDFELQIWRLNVPSQMERPGVFDLDKGWIINT